MTSSFAVGIDSIARRHEDRAKYRHYLRLIDPEAVLEHYGARNMTRRGSEVIHSCLIDQVDPHHMHGDENPSASMNIEKKLYTCYGYGGGSILWLILKMEGKEYLSEISGVLSRFLTGTEVSGEDFLAELERLMGNEEVRAEAIPRYHERVLRNWQVFHPYLKDRGITFDAGQRLQIGYDESDCRITIPHWAEVDGEVRLVGWQKRSLSDPRWPQTPPMSNGRTIKYQSSAGFPKNSTLYNLHRVTERGARHLIVVESPMSVAKAESMWDGTDTDPLGAVVATFGAAITDGQLRLMRPFERVTLYLDDDPAGQSGAQSAMERLYQHTSVMLATPAQGKDLADHDEPSEVRGIIESATPAVLAMTRSRT